jgi:hypothetical protein
MNARYRDNRTQKLRRAILPAAEFLRRFLQRVLPRGRDALFLYHPTRIDKREVRANNTPPPPVGGWKRTRRHCKRRMPEKNGGKQRLRQEDSGRGIP